MARRFLYVAVVVCVATFAYSPMAFAQDNSNGQLVISIKAYETADEGPQQKVLAEPTLVTIPGRPFSYNTGGTLKTKTGDEDLSIGTRVTGTLTRTRTGTVQVALKVSIGDSVSQDDDPETDMVKTEIIDIRTIVKMGEVKRLKWSASRWCEVRVDSVK